MAERIDFAGTWQRVSLRYAWVDAVVTVVWGVVFAAAAGSAGWFATREILVAAACAAAAFVVMLAVAIFSFLRVRTIGYQLRDDDLLVRRGMMFRRFVSVPYGRMQVVDITQGPVERMWKLKTLKFVTAAASSNVLLPGLPEDSAEQLRDRLVSLAESRRAGL